MYQQSPFPSATEPRLKIKKTHKTPQQKKQLHISLTKIALLCAL